MGIKKYKKWFGFALLLFLIVLTVIVSLLSEGKKDEKPNVSNTNHTQSEKQVDDWKKEVGTTYDEFTEDQEKMGEEAAKLAEEFYVQTYGEKRETSYFYAESVKEHNFVVFGVDSLDGRDVRFGEFHVNMDTKDVSEVDYLNLND